MLNINSVKSKIKKNVIEKLSKIDGVISVTFVGSFESSLSINLISDIDIIVIVNRLDKVIFEQIEANISEIDSNNIGLPNHDIKINMSFGPLKFNNDKTAVFHLMVYDIDGHKNHVLKSPFTCLDWQQNNSSYGENLRDIYSAHGVQIDDLLSSRRSLDGYIKDLKKKSISYRIYNFSKTLVEEEDQTFDLDDRHSKEYAYHVIKFLQKNLLKILMQKNLRIDIYDQVKQFNNLDKKFEAHSNFLIELHEWKYNNNKEPTNVTSRLSSFIKDLEHWINNLEMNELHFFRHGKTELNDGSFLGQGRDPDILEGSKINCKMRYKNVITSKLKRAINTGHLLESENYSQSSLLNEIDYGLVEGMSIADLSENFPSILHDWSLKKDPRFPEGENQADVQKRLNLFLKEDLLNDNSAIVTHNVFLRSLLGKTYNTELSKWYNFNPIHLENHKYFKNNNTLIPNFTKKQQEYYKDSISSQSFVVKKYAIFWTPSKKLNDFVMDCKKLCLKFDPKANYVNHPPHSTLFVFNSYERNQQDIINSINSSKISLKIDNWLTFENDILTGNDTLTLSINKSDVIMKFQKYVAETLVKFLFRPNNYSKQWAGVGANTVRNEIIAKMEKEYQLSQNMYGFPFVGDHWIPHITIASVMNKQLISKLKNKNFNFEDKIDGDICLYEINGDDHYLIHKWD